MTTNFNPFILTLLTYYRLSLFSAFFLDARPYGFIISPMITGSRDGGSSGGGGASGEWGETEPWGTCNMPSVGWLMADDRIAPKWGAEYGTEWRDYNYNPDLGRNSLALFSLFWCNAQVSRPSFGRALSNYDEATGLWYFFPDLEPTINTKPGPPQEYLATSPGEGYVITDRGLFAGTWKRLPTVWDDEEIPDGQILWAHDRFLAAFTWLDGQLNPPTLHLPEYPNAWIYGWEFDDYCAMYPSVLLWTSLWYLPFIGGGPSIIPYIPTLPLPGITWPHSPTSPGAATPTPSNATVAAHAISGQGGSIKPDDQ